MTDETELNLAAIQQANADYAAAHGGRPREGKPAKQLCILTCMDVRIDPLAAFGLSLGEAHVLRNAGGRASDDAIRSMALSAHALGAREFGVVHHTRCGLHGPTNDDLQQLVGGATGEDVSHIDFLSFADLDASVRDDVDAVVASGLLPADGVVWGATYDVDAATLTVVVPPRAARQ